jgi:serine/threonine-protein kinase
MSELVVGQQVGSFVLADQIGRTNMGEVWRAWDSANQQVALKTIAMDIRTDEMFLARFRQEAYEHRKLRHKSIVPIYDFFAEDDCLFLVMPFIEGGSLEDLLAREGQLPVQQALDISVQILEALDFAHQNMLIHRDVKPSNILMDNDRAYLTDFGIALPIGKTRLTTGAGLLGTPGYMSPEQITTPLDVDHLTDVYSFGCVLYEMLAGRPPFVAEGMDAGDVRYRLQRQIVDDQPIRLREFNPDVSPRLEHIIMTSLAKSRDDRFPGCGSFGRALDSIRTDLSSSPASIQPASAPGQILVEPVVVNQVESQLPQVGRVSTALYLTVSLVAGMLPFFFVQDRQFVLLFFLSAALSFVLQLRVLYKCWMAIQDGNARTTPGKAVGLLFVPFYSLFWASQAYPGFASDYNRLIHRRELRCRRQPVWLYWCFYNFNCFIMPVASLFVNFTTLSFLIAANVLLIVPVMTGTLCTALNRLSEARSLRQEITQSSDAKGGEVLA